ncbi:hypothetical protein O5559_28655, partial [Escherichia coli]|nr:hypothetical protein [Escherichia coli]
DSRQKEEKRDQGFIFRISFPLTTGSSPLSAIKPSRLAARSRLASVLPDGFRLCFGAFDDEDKIIGIAPVRVREWASSTSP